ncbi:hypothetical protein O0L34_g14832 [Tuta absoluta]|nr:hypothetical protein O0L34_g14832 [Tuta absoluta]
MKTKPDNVSERYEEVDGNDTDTDKNISEEPTTVDASAHSDDASEESFEIIDKNSLQEEKFDQISEIEDILPQLPSVKELARKFVSMENLNESVKPQQPIRRQRSKDNIFDQLDQRTEKGKQAYCFSITARSVSKEFREELKMSMATPLTVPGGSKEIPEGEEITKESSRPGSPLPQPGTIKSKLAFFESLKNRFNK